MAKILVVLPHDRFRDEEFEAVANTLGSEHEVSIGSSHHSEAKGQFGLLVNPDVSINFVEPGDYDCLVFIGGIGVEEYLNETSIMQLIQNFFHERKLICAIGTAVELLVYAGILTNRKVTTDASTVSKIQDAGAYYTGRSTEIDGDILTATGYESSQEFAEAIRKALQYVDTNRGLR